MIESKSCLYVERDQQDDRVVRGIRNFPLPKYDDDLVRIAVRYSSLNYKDALCANGHPGIAKRLPLIPGIDAAGEVLHCGSGAFQPGEEVMVFHADFGTKSDGGLSTVIDVPVDWVYRIPDGLDARLAMAVGTGGFTAAMCIDKLIKHGVTPASGEIVVTGATGGVGVYAVAMLAKLGYDVVASTGKLDRAEWLMKLGAAKVIGRDELNDRSDRPLLKGRWAGAVDSVGGNTLATILRAAQPHSCVTACGLVGGVDFEISVYPFILRGVALQGVDTAGIAPEYRASLWKRIADQWMIDQIEDLIDPIALVDIESKIQQILSGKILGRVVVQLSE